jgi:hypothetical protein
VRVLSPCPKCPAEEALGAADPAAQDIGRIEHRYSDIERSVHHRLRRRMVDAAAKVVAAEPDQRHAQAGPPA